MHPRSIATLSAAFSTVAALLAFAYGVSLPVCAQQETRSASTETSPALPAEVQAKLGKLQGELKVAQGAGDAKATAAALSGIGDLYFNISEFGKALDNYSQALTQARAAKDAQREAAALNGMAGCYVEQNQTEKAAQTYKQALEVTKASGDVHGQAATVEGIGWLTGSVGQWKTALQLHQKALTLARNAGDRDLEATVLLRLGVTYAALGSVDDAKQNAEQAIKIFHEIGDQEGEANTDAEMAAGYKNLQDNEKALEYGTQALALYRESGDRRKQNEVLRGIGLVYMTLGQPRKALESFNEALSLARESGDRASEMMALNGVGAIYFVTGENKKLLEVYNQALEISRAIGDEEAEAHALSHVGNAYYALGDLQKALDCYNQALPLFKHQGDVDGEADMLNNLGNVYNGLGKGQQALDFYDHAAPLYLQAHDYDGGAGALNNIGFAHLALSDNQKALEYFNQALPLYRQTSNKYATAKVLTNIGFAHVRLNQWQTALEYLNQAEPLEKEIGDRLDEAYSLTVIGLAYAGLGEKQKALEALNQALPIGREAGSPEVEAFTMDEIGAVFDGLGQNGKAQEYLKRALPMAAEVGSPLLQSMILNDLMISLKAAKPAMAIFYGKLGVNQLQQMRSNIQGLDKGLQAGFLLSKEDFYHGLADLLIAQGRLPEAQQVLDLLKQQEYSDYTRGEAANTMNPLALTPAEQQAEEDYQKSTEQIVALGNEWAELRKISQRTPEQEARYKQLSDQIEAANEGLSEYYKRLYTLFGANSNANKQVADVSGRVNELNQALTRMPHTVALYTMVGKDRTRIIVITGSARAARESAITEEDLNRKIAAFEQVLRNPSSDPRPAAQELYNILIGPVKRDLNLAHAETLVWSLDGALRYVPMAALFDGKRYVVESYNTVTITPVSIPHLNEKPDFSNLSAAAMGISRKYETDLPELKAVVGELDEVVKDPQVQGANGVLPGTILLDNRFTEKAMEDQLSGQHAVVHIASHFVFKPGDDQQSYLLLAGRDDPGKGFRLTVAEFNDNPNLALNDTELLTLSACETGMSGTASDGREVDGLGTTALGKGAKAVISTLWEVDDASTGALMSDFYRRWADGKGKVMKAEALREAQLDLLHGKVTPQSGASGRGVSAVENEPGNQAGPAGYAHPYYWAPFVLMGNWR